MIACFRLLEAALPVVGGAILGAAIGLSLGGWFGHRAGLGGWSILRRSIDSDEIRRLLEVSAAVWLLILIALSLNDVLPLHRNRRPVASDVAGVAALGVLVVLIRRGSISTGSLNRVVDPTLVAVPILAAIALAAVVVRVVPLTLRAAFHRQPVALAAHEADVGRSHRPTAPGDRHGLVDSGHRDVRAVVIRVRLDAPAGLS